MAQCFLCLFRPVDFSFSKAGDKFLWLDIYQLHLVGAVEYPVGNPLAHHHPGDGCDNVVEAFQMLNVYRGVYVDSRLEEFLDILIPFEMAAAFRVGVGQLIH